MAARELLVQRDVAIASRDDQLAIMTGRVARARDAMGEQLSLLETASDAADPEAISAAFPYAPNFSRISTSEKIL